MRLIAIELLYNPVECVTLGDGWIHFKIETV